MRKAMSPTAIVAGELKDRLAARERLCVALHKRLRKARFENRIEDAADLEIKLSEASQEIEELRREMERRMKHHGSLRRIGH